jgi:transposase InsO family protein
VILDLFSRRVVGWSMCERLEKKLELDALSMALADRQPRGGRLHHSDRGSHFASNRWDNAVAESFFAKLKLELPDPMEHAAPRPATTSSNT